MSTWIDFKALRSKLNFEDVLCDYGVEVKRRGTQHLGFCPLPSHEGKRNSKSFSAHLERGIFQCFGCGAKGNVIDFAAIMERLDPKIGRDLRKAAIKLRDRFAPTASVSKTHNPKAGFKTPPQEAALPGITEAGLINQPLDFELKDLDESHPYLVSRGITPDTIARFGLGFCRRGLLKDRVVIPLRDEKGRLVGYAGRVVDDSLVNEDNPRYRFPGRRTRNGQTYEFHKSLFLYNGCRFETPLDDLVVVEGFVSVWWLVQNGFENVVATMGSECSERQGKLVASLVKPMGRVWIMSDGDKAGERHALSALAMVSPERFVRWVRLEKDAQPTDCNAAQLRKLLGR
jgi:DNA primase